MEKTHKATDRFKGVRRVKFSPHNGAGPCGSELNGRKVGIWNGRQILVIWDDNPKKVVRVDAWNYRLQPV